MAIADKLTYLNATKTLLREAITRSGHYLTEADPFRSYPYALLRDEHSLKLDFLRGEYIAKNWRDGTVSRVGFDSIITFTRGSGGGRFNHLGVFEWVGNNVARIDHDPATVDTSTSSVTIGAGLKTFAVSRLYPVGQYVRATADASNWLSGRVIASTVSSVTLWVDRVVGTGTFASWTLIRVLGLLVEESRTNLLTYSSDFANEGWIKTGSAFTITPNATLGLDGAVSGTLIVPSTATSPFVELSRLIDATGGTAYAATYIVKDGGLRYAQLIGPANVFGTGYVNFDLQAGTITAQSSGTSQSLSASIVRLGGGWVAICVKVAALQSTGFRASLNFIKTATTARGVNEGAFDGTSGIYIWGAQLEAGSFPTSYIPTTTAQVTRAADIASVNELSPWYNPEQGTLFVEWATEHSASDKWIFSLSDGTANNDMYSGQFTGRVSRTAIINGGVVQAVGNGTATMAGVPAKGAFGYKANDAAWVSQGIIGFADVDCSIPSVDRLRIGAQAALIAGNYLNGHIRSLRYWPRRLSNDDLQRLTS